MDRNRCSYLHSNMSLDVALRKESVDRNRYEFVINADFAMSLSARRAWIEIFCFNGKQRRIKSLSARRAWIEITGGLRVTIYSIVALRKESVDRNYDINSSTKKSCSRSPQGERG